jgi:hypothetical protein
LSADSPDGPEYKRAARLMVEAVAKKFKEAGLE